MENLPKHKILQFHSDTLQYVRREGGLDKPGQMDAAIDLLEDWVKKQVHFTKTDFSREYLERTIITNKGSVERAKLQMDKICTMKLSLPLFFERTDVKNDFEMMHDYVIGAWMPKMTKEHYRIVIGKPTRNVLTTNVISLVYSYIALALEHIKANEYCSGLIFILDYRALNIIDTAAQLNLRELQQFVQLVMQGHQMRLKGIHIVTDSDTVDIALRILKQFLSKKIGDRIKAHKTLDSLHECVPKDLLPKDLDGEQKTLDDLSNDWIELFSTKENIEFTKEMFKATIKENLRNGTTHTNEDILGIPGSFKKLCVD